MANKGGPRENIPEHYVDADPITPADATPLPDGPCVAIFVGVAGDITLQTLDSGDTVLFSNVPVGVFKMGAAGVDATGTAATNLVALY